MARKIAIKMYSTRNERKAVNAENLLKQNL